MNGLDRLLKISMLGTVLVAVASGCEPRKPNSERGPAPAALERAVDDLLSPLVQADIISGVVLVAKGDRVLLSKGYGLADRDEGIPNGPLTQYPIGSNTKSFTAVATMMLAERGLLNLEDPISTFLPDFPNGEDITVQHLLSNTSGIRSYVYLPEYREMLERDPSPGLQEIIDWFKVAPPESSPGESFSYSNSNFVLLTAIIEKVSGQDYGSFLRENILRPAGMTHTGLDFSEATNPATGYSHTDYGVLEAATPEPPFGIGDGGLFSTAEDLLRWSRILRTERILSEESENLMFRKHSEYYGLGWMIHNRFGRTVIHHGGAVFGFMSDIQYVREEDVTVITLYNMDCLLEGRIDQALVALVLGEDPEPLFKTQDADILDTFRDLSGRYSVGGADSIRVSVEGGSIWIQETGRPKVAARALSSDQLYLDEVNAILRFEPETQDEPARLTAHFGLFLVTGERPPVNVEQ